MARETRRTRMSLLGLSVLVLVVLLAGSLLGCGPDRQTTRPDDSSGGGYKSYGGY